MNSPRILIVDDTPTNVAVIRGVLQAEGFETLVAHDGPSGRDLSRREHPDLILLDIMMPRMSGGDFLTVARRKHPELSRVPVVVVTAKDLTEEDQAVMKLIPKDRPTILVMNKVDLMKDKNALLKEIKTMSESYSFKAMVPVSAKKNKHLDHLLATVRDFLPEQPFIYG